MVTFFIPLTISKSDVALTHFANFKQVKENILYINFQYNANYLLKINVVTFRNLDHIISYRKKIRAQLLIAVKNCSTLIS